jgi:hypothetical protein
VAWTAPMTAASNSTFTAAQFNAHIRDNLLETEPAKSSTVDAYFVSTGANAITQRTPGSHVINTMQTTSSTSYTNLATVGPVVTVTTGTAALVLFSAGMANTSADAQMAVSVAVSGASTVAESDTWAIITDGMAAWGNPNEPADQHNRRGSAKLFTGLTAGSNTFTMKYKVGSGTGRFRYRELIVYPL